VAVYLCRILPAVGGSFMAARVVHRCSAECDAICRRRFAARGHRSMIALSIVQTVIDVTIKARRAVIPGSGADKYAARKPLRPVISIGSTVVGRYFVVSIRAHRGNSDAHSNPRIVATATRE